MIGHIEGVVLRAKPESLIVSASGVGYLVFTTPETAAAAAEGSTISLWTHLAVRENALDLYGFSSESELRLFELLLSVSGIGPKSALGTLSTAGASALTSAIAKGDASSLIKVSGIGKKTAEKIVLELHEKLGDVALPDESSQDNADALDALVAMGYSEREARDALKQVPDDLSGSNEVLREALRQLSK